MQAELEHFYAYGEAFGFAVLAHGDQRYGKHPYATHLSHVASVLQAAGASLADPNTWVPLVAAPLHDVIEDTRYQYKHIADKFGVPVAEAVYACTDDLGRNHAEQHATVYARLAASPTGRCVKLADRIANLTVGRYESSRQRGRYLQEHPQFYALCGAAYNVHAGPAMTRLENALWAHYLQEVDHG